MAETATRTRRGVARLLTLALVAASVLLGVPAAAAPRLVSITGSGSTWSQNALDQWRADVRQNNITVHYSGVGSTAGRNAFAQGTVDFAVSEIEFGAEANEAVPRRKFAYMPIVAGGTSFMYNLKIGGRRVTNLRLSGDVIAKIFTGSIDMWNDAAIRADNPGLNMPARRIVPVVRSDGSGTTAQFVKWMNNQYPSIWRPWCRDKGRTEAQCNVLSFYPPGFTAQAGSSQIAGYVAGSNAEGAITYVEYSYAKENGFPVVKVLNKAGYYVEPTANSVAVALTKAQIETGNPNAQNYLTQKLEGVYNDRDRRTYPLSSYSYMVIPLAHENGVTEDKAYTLGRFAYYFLCQGQQKVDLLGYSPLPINLVEAGFNQVKRIPGVVQEARPIRSCNNPTFSTDGTNTLARTAQNPPECDRKGNGQQCTAGTGGAAGTPTGNSNPSGGGNPTTGNPGGPGNPGGAGPNATAGPTASQSAGPGLVDPATGEVIGTGDGGGGQQFVAGVPVSLDGEGGWRLRHTMMVLAGVVLLALVIGPPLIFRRTGATGAGAVGRDR
ncbi:phosphate ABC transporter substrate-binding protein PstS [Plantactinospora sp. KLBMP9567]|uniref:phosphate ABC transporter substrate-binding protein PstS n=1 Tax=Plantactinospora sp. KLBMP9567 TaxID=3085900 RepID=UPI002981A027|nr:phosphate ABC transporter substrate-binding protein PstS [Plantactinospora sp. KLBMP9567]MDW5324450.1 phosphate ABC transporter substrate-binding protein PstS [Plantactinospora sp. KLBMP9567]